LDIFFKYFKNKMKIITNRTFEFSLFFNVDMGLFNCTPLQTINLSRLFEIYQSTYLIEKSKELSIATDEQKEVIKNQLPYFTYSGSYSYRNNESILSYNSSLLPLDIDGLSEEDAIKVQKILSEQRGCLMSIISPRCKGVKSLIYLGVGVDCSNHYQTLSNNIEKIARELNIQEFESKIDPNQFKLSQPFFIGYNKHNFFNLDAIPTLWGLENIERKVVEHIPPTITNHTPTNSLEQKRIYCCIDRICKENEYFFKGIGKGDRHRNIWRVRNLASILHYSPNLQEEMKGRMYNSIVAMYNSEDEAKRVGAIKTFENCWGSLADEKNDFIEYIIEDEKQKEKIRLEELKKLKSINQ
jgi:hypothetical protein